MVVDASALLISLPPSAHNGHLQSLAAGGAALGAGPVICTGVLVWLLARYPTRKLVALAAEQQHVPVRVPQSMCKLWRQAIEMVLMSRAQGRHAATAASP